MIKIAEVLMFIAFAMAALPLAFLGINDIIHFCGNPDALAIRESTREALFVIVVAPLIAISLLVGGAYRSFFHDTRSSYSSDYRSPSHSGMGNAVLNS